MLQKQELKKIAKTIKELDGMLWGSPKKDKDNLTNGRNSLFSVLQRNGYELSFNYSLVKIEK